MDSATSLSTRRITLLLQTSKVIIRACTRPTSHAKCRQKVHCGGLSTPSPLCGDKRAWHWAVCTCRRIPGCPCLPPSVHTRVKGMCDTISYTLFLPVHFHSKCRSQPPPWSARTSRPMEAPDWLLSSPPPGLTRAPRYP